VFCGTSFLMTKCQIVPITRDIIVSKDTYLGCLFVTWYKITVGFGYRTTGLTTTPIVKAPTFVCGLVYNISKYNLKKLLFL
jgi:hypothetical protein